MHRAQVSQRLSKFLSSINSHHHKAKYLLFAGLIAASAIPLTHSTPVFAATACSNYGIGGVAGQSYALGIGYPQSYSTLYYGTEGHITTPSTAPSFPMNNYNFTDEAVWILAQNQTSSAAGLEVGWGEGYLTNAGIYQTVPQLYATFNGPGAVAGPDVALGSENYYVTYTNSSGDAVFVVRHNGTDIWKKVLSYQGTPGGETIGGGETYSGAGAEIPMGPATLSGLQNLTGSGSWSNWSGIAGCVTAGSPYTLNVLSVNSVSNSGG